MGELVRVTTAVYGGRDLPYAPAGQLIDADIDWVCVTDDPDLAAPEPWRVLCRPPQAEHPNLAAKFPKMMPPAYVRSVWIDANIEITARTFLAEALACTNDGIAVYDHPRRSCVYAEAKASLGAESQGGRYDDLPIEAQMASYRRGGHPENAGLYACGVIAWDGSDQASKLGRAWLAECRRWGYQDQLAFPVVCRALDITPGVFPHPQITAQRNVGAGYLENPWLRIHPHRPSD